MIAARSMSRFMPANGCAGCGAGGNFVLERAAKLTGTGSRTGGLYSLTGVIGAVLLYSAFHIAARLIASANLGEDDPLDVILTQTLALGYRPGQPPLYDWLLWGLGQVLGPGALRFQVLKYGVLTATCGFMFLGARRVMKGDALWAFLSVEALALIYQISWRFHEGFTHAVGAMCAVAALFWAMLRLVENRRSADYALFGLVAGLGLLTVTTVWVYLGALLGAACLQPALRRVILDRRIALSAVVAALIAGPHFVWLAVAPGGLDAILPAWVSHPKHGHWYAVLLGIRRAFSEPIMYLSPLLFLFPLFFPGMLANVRRTVRLSANTSREPDYEQLILHLTLLNIAVLLAAALVFGINRYPVHALMPLFLITSIWLTAQARKAARGSWEVRRFVIMALSVAVFAFFARLANMYVLEPVCQICRWGIPYAELAEGIRKTGFTQGRIVVFDEELGGNLKLFFPRAQVVLAGPKPYAPPPPQRLRFADTVYVWDGSESLEDAAKKFTLPHITTEALAKAGTISIPWRRHYWKPDGYRVSEWRVLVTASGK